MNYKNVRNDVKLDGNDAIMLTSLVSNFIADWDGRLPTFVIVKNCIKEQSYYMQIILWAYLAQIFPGFITILYLQFLLRHK